MTPPTVQAFLKSLLLFWLCLALSNNVIDAHDGAAENEAPSVNENRRHRLPAFFDGSHPPHPDYISPQNRHQRLEFQQKIQQAKEKAMQRLLEETLSSSSQQKNPMVDDADPVGRGGGGGGAFADDGPESVRRRTIIRRESEQTEIVTNRDGMTLQDHNGKKKDGDDGDIIDSNGKHDHSKDDPSQDVDYGQVPSQSRGPLILRDCYHRQAMMGMMMTATMMTTTTMTEKAKVEKKVSVERKEREG
jgi:hypothetical protein